MSTGGSHAGNREVDRAGLKNELCRRSARASISQASDHIHLFGKSDIDHLSAFI
ncbi:hypothetical protein MXD81_03300 [Microbacteriaceae bacterium K1510]|nr:hypothetical protein [Microbacteriaceae bacterium K1510]